MREGKLSIRAAVAQCKGVGDMLFSVRRNVPAPLLGFQQSCKGAFLHRQVSLD